MLSNFAFNFNLRRYNKVVAGFWWEPCEMKDFSVPVGKAVPLETCFTGGQGDSLVPPHARGSVFLLKRVEISIESAWIQILKQKIC